MVYLLYTDLFYFFSFLLSWFWCHVGLMRVMATLLAGITWPQLDMLTWHNNFWAWLEGKSYLPWKEVLALFFPFFGCCCFWGGGGGGVECWGASGGEWERVWFYLLLFYFFACDEVLHILCIHVDYGGVCVVPFVYSRHEVIATH